ncbi:MAG: TolC family protein, partial [Burkholderiaceae bacterium]|nr:TolC family protein [Burkholderiaceae bacterium]
MGYLACLLAFTGCAVGPDYAARTPAVDADFVQGVGRDAEPAAESVATFWRGFNDAQLNALIEQALTANVDVKLAQARLQEARANAGFTAADRLPSIGTGAGVARDDPSGAERSATEYSVSGNFNWELDFFGRKRRSVE